MMTLKSNNHAHAKTSTARGSYTRTGDITEECPLEVAVITRHQKWTVDNQGSM